MSQVPRLYIESQEPAPSATVSDALSAETFQFTHSEETHPVPDHALASRTARQDHRPSAVTPHARGLRRPGTSGLAWTCRKTNREERP